jgi:hypothetical protein
VLVECLGPDLSRDFSTESHQKFQTELLNKGCLCEFVTVWSLFLFLFVTVFEEEGNCIVYLEMRADELMRHLILGELTNYRVVRTSPEPLHCLMSLFVVDCCHPHT